jgi:hypothetical protein
LLDLRFKSHGILKISAKVQACSWPLLAQQNLPKIAKICQKMIRLRNFEIPPKFEISAFFAKKSNSMNRGGTKAFSYCLDF